MESGDISELVGSMIRLHGKAQAFSLADRYACDSNRNGDIQGYNRWATAAAQIAGQIELDKRFRSVPSGPNRD
jgi:hypothetical protein